MLLCIAALCYFLHLIIIIHYYWKIYNVFQYIIYIVYGSFCKYLSLVWDIYLWICVNITPHTVFNHYKTIYAFILPKINHYCPAHTCNNIRGNCSFYKFAQHKFVYEYVHIINLSLIGVWLLITLLRTSKYLGQGLIYVSRSPYYYSFYIVCMYLQHYIHRYTAKLNLLKLILFTGWVIHTRHKLCRQNTIFG